MENDNQYLKKAEDASLEIPQDVTDSVRNIVDTIRTKHDDGVRELTREFDGVEREDLRVNDEELEAAAEALTDEEKHTIKNTIKNVQEFHEEQFSYLNGFEREFEDGIRLGTRLVPVETAGVYVPGGRKPLIAAPAMTIVPATVVGVETIVACAPPQESGSVQAAQLYAMDQAGADEIYAVGGAQAIAAMAYGTETIPAVAEITGPGNIFVTEAKRQVFGQVGIDFLAGPTEVLIIADENSDPGMVATDLLAQAEHDPRSRPILVTTDSNIAEHTLRILVNKLSDLRSKEVAERCWEKNGEVILVDDLSAATEVANEYAVEHLQLMIDKPRQILDDLHNYGSLFLGYNAPVVFGDKAIGTNHTLPTLQVAKYSGGINVTTYLKVLTHQDLTPQGADTIAPWAAKMCELEGTHAHQISAEKRIITEQSRDLARKLELSPESDLDLSKTE